ncbi:hypothetical protein [Streptomyces sp. NPDC059957]|uniref:hypothetical protein n=1 Tax=Streptomyces sp. NPDC059957 TaxID=3347016 RepID=UPI00365AFBB2
MRRWSLPLLLTALLTTPGCVTIHPAPAPPVGIRATAPADHKPPADPRAVRTGTALPLSPLPEPAPPAPAGPAPRQEHAPGPGRPAAEDRTSSRQSTATPRRTHQGPTRPRRVAAPHRATPRKPSAKARTTGTAKAKPGARTPAPRRPGHTSPGVRAGDMAALCNSPHGMNSPAITELC